MVETQKILYDACVLKECNKHFLRRAEEHEQLAEWLEELKELRELNQKNPFLVDMIKHDSIVRNKAIDDFVENISLEISESIIWDIIATMNKNSSLSDTSDKIVDYVINTANEIAEQLKAGGKDDKRSG